MAAELRVSEYVPGNVVWTKRFCKCVLLGCLAAVAVLFAEELRAVRDLRTQCDRIEEAAVRYGHLVEEGDMACGDGDMRLGEQCYLTALDINQAKPGPYLKLAQIYREYRRYDLALWILEEYPGADEEIAVATGEVRAEMDRLEVSVFQEMPK